VALSALEKAEQAGLLVRDHARIAPTPRGQRFPERSAADVHVRRYELNRECVRE
jgi:hypothetical protein